jgi:hypothetical protein
MKMIVKKPGEAIRVVDLPDKYETIKFQVDGYIEAVYLEKNVICWINEEGKLTGLPFNFNVGNVAIVGNALFVGDDGEGGSKDLTDEQVAYIKSLFVNKSSSYQKWLDRFVEEKELETMIWTFSKDGDPFVIRTIDSLSVIAFLRSIPDKETQKKVIDLFTKIDFVNGSIYPTLKDFAQIMFDNDL